MCILEKVLILKFFYRNPRDYKYHLAQVIYNKGRGGVIKKIFCPQTENFQRCGWLFLHDMTTQLAVRLAIHFSHFASVFAKHHEIRNTHYTLYTFHVNFVFY